MPPKRASQPNLWAAFYSKWLKDNGAKFKGKTMRQLGMAVRNAWLAEKKAHPAKFRGKWFSGEPE